jgi:hypothetical protein
MYSRQEAVAVGSIFMVRLAACSQLTVDKWAIDKTVKAKPFHLNYKDL